MGIFSFIWWRLQDKKRAKKWRKLNPDNETMLSGNIPFERVSVGNFTYGELNILCMSDVGLLKIGGSCSISPNVTFLVGAEHKIDTLTTFPHKVKTLKMQKSEAISKGDIVIDDEVWIGYGATIMSGVHIGQGAVIAAKAVVTKDVPPYAVVGGVPAKVIKYRFSKEIIEELLQIDYSKLTKEQIKDHINDLYAPVTENTNFDWLPKK